MNQDEVELLFKKPEALMNDALLTLIRENHNRHAILSLLAGSQLSGRWRATLEKILTQTKDDFPGWATYFDKKTVVPLSQILQNVQRLLGMTSAERKIKLFRERLYVNTLHIALSKKVKAKSGLSASELKKLNKLVN